MLNQNGFIAVETHGRNEYLYVGRKSSNLLGFMGENHKCFYTFLDGCKRLFYLRWSHVMVIGLFHELFNNLGPKILQKLWQKNYEFYVAFDMFGRLYSWKWLCRILWLLARYGYMYKKHFCAVWWEAEKSKNLVSRIRVKYQLHVNLPVINQLSKLISFQIFNFWSVSSLSFTSSLTQWNCCIHHSLCYWKFAISHSALRQISCNNLSGFFTIK